MRREGYAAETNIYYATKFIQVPSAINGAKVLQKEEEFKEEG